MLKKRNLIFLCLLILGVFLITSCLPKPPVTEGILKGQVIVPEGSKQLTGQALPDATVNIIDLATGAVIATTTTDANGYYQVFVPAGGPYILQAVKNGVVVLQITPQVEVGIEYDLGTADCSTTAVALIVQAMLVAEDYPNNIADINLTDIETDPDFNDVMNPVCSTIKAGEDPALSAVVQQAVKDFLYPPVPPPPPTPTYTVTFDSQGGSEVDSQTVAHGGKVTEPTAPTRTGYTFDGWYKELECTNAWTFATDKVTSVMTLYAKWTINSYTVTFDKNDGDTEANPMTKPATHGGNVGTLPEAPTKTGYTFASWNTQANGSGSEFTAATVVIADITVYAQWTINTYTVTFDSKGGSSISSQTVGHGGKVTEPTTAPTKEGCAFGDWYKEPEYINVWDFNTDTVTSGVTLYAKWMSVHNLTKDTYYYTIQAALDDTRSINRTANRVIPYDTIEVADGTYNESIAFPMNKKVILQSLNGASSTFITGVDGSATVTCEDTLQGTTLEGFTVTHNSGDTGRGIYITNTNCYLTINNSTISDNLVTDNYGGGIKNYGTLTITGSTISDNTAISGGGICNESTGTLTITGSEISDNLTTSLISRNGGGILNFGNGIITINSCTISGNSAWSGGGIDNHNNGTLTIIDSTISGNTASSSSGGGIYNYSTGTLTITGSEISSNSGYIGGGILNSRSSSMSSIIDTTISGNTASSGGGIYNMSVLTITGCTISGNSASWSGGGIENCSSATPTLTINGCTISGNSAGSDGGGIWNTETLIINGSEISYNLSSYGGGISNDHAGTITIEGGSTISSNSAVWQGGGIYNNSTGTLTITGSEISSNSASNSVSISGGGIYLKDETDITIGGTSETDPNNNTFTDNKKGDAVSADQHICNSSGDCRATYPNNTYNPN